MQIDNFENFGSAEDLVDALDTTGALEGVITTELETDDLTKPVVAINQEETDEPVRELTDPVKVVPTTEKVSKAAQAREIFAANYGKPGVARKDIMAKFKSELGLSQACASTYYQQCTDRLKANKLTLKQ